MPLSPPASPRQLQHERHIAGEGFRRDDGLWDIEVVLTDRKTYGFDNKDFGHIAAGTPYHGMGLRLTLDHDLNILEVEAVIDASPYRICPQVVGNFQRLKGEKIGPGWRARVSHLVGRTEGCRHLRDMLDVAVVVAFQAILAGQVDEVAFLRGDDKPPHLDQCHALATDSPVVARDYPKWYTGKPSS